MHLHAYPLILQPLSLYQPRRIRVNSRPCQQKNHTHSSNPNPIQTQIYIQIMPPLLTPLIRLIIPLALLSTLSEATPIPYTYPDSDSTTGRSGVDVGTAGSGSGRGSEWRYADPALMREVEGLRSRGWEEVSILYLLVCSPIYLPKTLCAFRITFIRCFPSINERSLLLFFLPTTYRTNLPLPRMFGSANFSPLL